MASNNDFNYIQVNYDLKKAKNIANLFPNKEKKYIVLDDVRIKKEKYNLENEEALNEFFYLQEKYDIVYDYIISNNGTLYKMSPVDKAGSACSFDKYSYKAGTMLPSACPQYDTTKNKPGETPDQYCISIGVASDNSDEPTFEQRATLVSLLNSLMLEHESLKPNKVVCRNLFPRQEIVKNSTGHIFYKNNAGRLLTLSTLAKNQFSQCKLKESDVFYVKPI